MLSRPMLHSNTSEPQGIRCWFVWANEVKTFVSHRHCFCFRLEPVLRFQPQDDDDNGRNNYRYYEKDQDATDESPPSFLALGLNPMISADFH